MIAQMKLEWAEIYHSKVNVILFLLLLIFMFSPLLREPHHTPAEYQDFYQSQVQIAEKRTAGSEKGQTTDPTDQLVQQMGQQAKLAVRAFQNKDSHEIAKAAVNYRQLSIVGQKSGRLLSGSLIEQEADEAMFKIIGAENIDYFGEVGLNAPGINYLSSSFLELLPVIIFLVGAVIFFAPAFSQFGASRTHELTDLVPLTRKTIIWAKFVIYYGVALFALLLLWLLPMVLLSIRNGFGYLTFPLIRTRDGIALTITSSGKYLLQLAIILALLILFVLLLTYTFSQIVRSSVVSLILMLVTILGCASLKESTFSFSRFLPSTYFHPNSAILGSPLYDPIVVKTSFMLAVIVLVTSNLILLFIGLMCDRDFKSQKNFRRHPLRRSARR